MDFFVNTFFPNGWAFIMIFFMIVGLIGAVGGIHIANRERIAAPAIGVALVLVVLSYTFYQVTSSVITEQILATETTTPVTIVTQTPELVYTYGADQPITLAEHERQLAYSAAHSPGDDE